MTSFVEEARREKLKELRKRGVEPFAYRFERTGTANSVLESFREGDQTVHRLAGRLVLLRPMGKATFGHLEDASGKIQLYFKRDVLGDDAYGILKVLDLGDVVGVEGPAFRTQTGDERRGDVAVDWRRIIAADSLLSAPPALLDDGLGLLGWLDERLDWVRHVLGR